MDEIQDHGIKIGSEEDVYVTHVENPWTFYCQLESLNNGKSVKDPCGQLFQVGDLISAVYSEDSRWYRAVVKEKTSHNLIRVHYIDYGDTSVISVDQETVSLEKIRQMPCELLRVPGQAFACCLSGFSPSEGSWLSEANKKFYDLTENLVLEAEVVEIRENN
uniref:Tudor domain containing 6 n=1 Tax=Malurus cyaneus samueli TaxID=2593467 RepID=A0A8C5T8Y9_9PASS